jgi:hypothetical protein
MTLKFRRIFPPIFIGDLNGHTRAILLRTTSLNFSPTTLPMQVTTSKYALTATQTPQTNDFRIDYVGHNASASGVTVYQGNGAGWAEFTGWTWPDSIFVNDTISASPLNSTPHRIVELSMDRDLFDTSTATPAYAPWTRVAVYDENNSTVIAWPPTEQYVPDDWGLETGVYESIPEALTVGVVVLLSSVAVVVSFYCLRKRSKTEGHSSVKTGEITYKG